jgi:hypothetical protein
MLRGVLRWLASHVITLHEMMHGTPDRLSKRRGGKAERIPPFPRSGMLRVGWAVVVRSLRWGAAVTPKRQNARRFSALRL